MSIKLPYRLTPSPCANTQSYSLAVNSSNASKATSSSSSRKLLELASSKQRPAEFLRFSISGMTPPTRNSNLLFNPIGLNLEQEPFGPVNERNYPPGSICAQPHIGTNRNLLGGEQQPLLSQEIRLFGYFANEG